MIGVVLETTLTAALVVPACPITSGAHQRADRGHEIVRLHGLSHMNVNPAVRR